MAVYLNSSHTAVPRSGYDLPLTGAATKDLYRLHIPALVCIVGSCVSAVTVITLSFKQLGTHFFSWSKSDRLIVYISLCDGLFTFVHFFDHMQVLLTNDHVRPYALCVFHATILNEFFTAQISLDNIAAFNIFLLIFWNKDIPFGKYDHRITLYSFGVPLVSTVFAIYFGQFGPNGMFCYMDAVKGVKMNLIFITIPFLVVFSTNVLLYSVTVFKIHRQSKAMMKLNDTKMTSNTTRVAKNMSLFIVAFVGQWWAAGVFGVWSLIDRELPLLMLNLLSTFSNLGGVFNGIIFLVFRHRRLKRDKKNIDTLNKLYKSNPALSTPTTTLLASPNLSPNPSPNPSRNPSQISSSKLSTNSLSLSVIYTPMSRTTLASPNLSHNPLPVPSDHSPSKSSSVHTAIPSPIILRELQP